MDKGADSRIGRTFSRYTLERVIGMGGMSTVYEARHQNGHRVAVKLLKPELSIQADVRRRFLREGYAANRVDHPGVVRISDDHTTDDGGVFLVLELLEGQTLAARAKEVGGKLPCSFVIDVGRQLLQILAAAHAAGVIHRDVKPENVLVRGNGAIKLLDFGIAQIRDPAESSVTATGRMLGTPAFMPPEQAYGRRSEIDERSDVWSAGATLFTLLTGRVVHSAPTAEETLVKAATEDAPPLRTIAPEIAAPIAAVIDRALAREKDARWPSAAAMLAALETAAAETVACGVTPSRWKTRGYIAGLAIFGVLAAWLIAQSPVPALAADERPYDPPPAIAARPAVIREFMLPLDATREGGATAGVEIRKHERPLQVADAAAPGPTHCGFDIDEDGRRWPRRCFGER